MITEIEIFLPTEYGDFKSRIYRDQDENEHILMIHEKTDFQKPVLVRIHSECMTGDLFHSLRCDCGYQLRKSMEMIADEGGVLIYLRQEGRGIGLTQKYYAYQNQDMGYDTVEANEQLGLPADLRTFGVAAEMLKDIGVKRVRLLTNNPKKLRDLKAKGIEIVERIPIVSSLNEHNARYIKTKEEKMGHLYDSDASVKEIV
jgi:3,4-dihydroxy 2-butanone 4-phosphate synthase/GTP cyclohydrolase II